jgi:Uma2 family endonuclease
MQDVIQNPPRTLMEVFKMLPEGTRAEIINGVLYMSPAPTTDHQEISITLSSHIFHFVTKKKLGKVYASPIDVYLNDNNSFQPDIVFISKENNSIVKKKGIQGCPDLIVEILSPGTKNFDLVKKKKIYEKSGVQEYWIVDPATKECRGFKLTEEKFAELKIEKGKLSSPLLKHTFKF